MLTQDSNTAIISEVVQQLVTSTTKEKFVLIDGDRTLSPIDSTQPFLKYAGIDRQTLESCFETTHYSFDMFLNAARLYSKIPPEEYKRYCQQAVQEVELHTEFIDFIQKSVQWSQVVVVTAGLRVLWGYLLEKYALHDMTYLIGGNHFHFDNYIIDQVSKGHVVDELHAHGKYTIAMGDSLVDYDMLTKAHKGFLVVDHRRNDRVISHLTGNANISQISFTDFVHDNMSQTSLPEVLENHLKF